ncbi:MAG: hypothetical protein IJ214_07235, partial [Clostridia bacterium]|nr:hypothetical protein [Clostridia bacterium]
MKHLQRILTLALAVCLILTTFGSSAAAEAEKVVVLGNTAAWEALHPLSSNRDQHVAFLYPIYESWVTLTNKGEVLPRLFDSWEQDAENPRVLVCHLNEKATWSDGEPITAADIEFTMRVVTDPELPLTTRTVGGNFVGTDATGVRIEGEEFGVKALDEHNVRLQFKDNQPATPLALLYGLRYTYTLPEHILKDVPIASLPTDPFWENPVTSGAFTVGGIISGERIEYIARDDYYLGRPQMDRLVIRVIPADGL